MATSQTTFVRLKDPPQYLFGDLNPSYCSIGGNHIIISLHNLANLYQFVTYDLDKQVITQKIEFPMSHSNPIPQTHCYMEKHDTFYIFTADGIIAFDLDKNTSLMTKPEAINKENYNESVSFSNCKYIPSINELILISGHAIDNPFRYNPKENRITKLQSKALFTKDSWGTLIYRESTQQLLLLQKKSQDVIVSDINIDSNTDVMSMSDWRVHAPKLLSPDDKTYNDINSRYWNVTLGFDQIIFYFDGSHQTKKGLYNIWCLDLDHKDKWYKSQYTVPVRWSNIFKDVDNYVHLMAFRSNNYHWKASLFDLIPTEIVKLNGQKYDPLIVGFIKELERKKEMTFIPMYLKKLIVQFYPIFI